jgi:hypothetical protein
VVISVSLTRPQHRRQRLLVGQPVIRADLDQRRSPVLRHFFAVARGRTWRRLIQGVGLPNRPFGRDVGQTGRNVAKSSRVGGEEREKPLTQAP